MVSPEIVKEWLDKADEDFKFASINLTEGHNFFAQICFHFQQAAEKYLKSFIVANDLEFEKTHNLIKLLNTCSEKESVFLAITEECERLTPLTLILAIRFTSLLAIQRGKPCCCKAMPRKWQGR